MRSPVAPLLLCFILAACASSPSPEDTQMSAALAAQGKLLLASGKTADARDIYASAVNRDENNGRAWNGLGASYDLLGKRGEAEDAYQHALDLNPNDPAAINNMAHLYIEEGESDKAVNLLESHMNDAKMPPVFQQNLAAAQARQALDHDIYADLGSYPTEGMAQGHLTELRDLMGSDAEGLSFEIATDVKITGGVPVFTLKATGRKPQSICKQAMALAFPCVPHGK